MCWIREYFKIPKATDDEPDFDALGNPVPKLTEEFMRHDEIQDNKDVEAGTNRFICLSVCLAVCLSVSLPLSSLSLSPLPPLSPFLHPFPSLPLSLVPTPLLCTTKQRKRSNHKFQQQGIIGGSLSTTSFFWYAASFPEVLCVMRECVCKRAWASPPAPAPAPAPACPPTRARSCSPALLVHELFLLCSYLSRYPALQTKALRKYGNMGTCIWHSRSCQLLAHLLVYAHFWIWQSKSTCSICESKLKN